MIINDIMLIICLLVFGGLLVAESYAMGYMLTKMMDDSYWKEI